MNTQLEQNLRSTAAGLTLETPVAEVLTRGSRIRRHRRRAVGAGVTGALAVTAFGVTALAGPQPSQGPIGAVGPARSDAFQTVSWSSPTTNLTDEQLVAVQKTCGASAREAAQTGGLTERGWGLPGTISPVAAELRDGTVLTYFRQGRDYATCELELTEAGRFRTVGQTAGIEKAAPTDGQVALVTMGAADPGPMGGKLSDVFAVAQTSSDVARVEIVIAGERYTSPVNADDLVFFWFADDQFTQADLDQATITSLDTDGNVLSRSTKGF